MAAFLFFKRGGGGGEMGVRYHTNISSSYSALVEYSAVGPPGRLRQEPAAISLFSCHPSVYIDEVFSMSHYFSEIYPSGCSDIADSERNSSRCGPEKRGHLGELRDNCLSPDGFLSLMRQVG